MRAWSSLKVWIPFGTWGFIGVMEKKMETTKAYWGYIGIMENGNYYALEVRKEHSLKQWTGP